MFKMNMSQDDPCADCRGGVWCDIPGAKHVWRRKSTLEILWHKMGNIELCVYVQRKFMVSSSWGLNDIKVSCWLYPCLVLITRADKTVSCIWLPCRVSESMPQITKASNSLSMAPVDSHCISRRTTMRQLGGSVGRNCPTRWSRLQAKFRRWNLSAKDGSFREYIHCDIGLCSCGKCLQAVHTWRGREN